jgi:rod shape-determining protein MreD
MKRHLIIIFIIIIEILIQLNFLYYFPGFKNYFNPFLLLMIYLTLIYGWRKGIIWGAIGGFILDIYSLLNFGVLTISLLASILIAYFLFNRFFTNRSLYSLNILIICGILTYNFSLAFISWILYSLNQSSYIIIVNYRFIINLLIQIIISCSAVTLIYLLFNYITQRLKKTFLIRENF